jgi:prevent-host-death family protein
MSDISTAEARKNLSDLVNRVAYGKERVVLTRHGKQLCALVPIEDLSFLDRIREMAGRHDIADALGEKDAGDAVAWSDLKRELGLSG